MRDFRGLKVWEKAHELTLLIYRTSSVFPSDERYGLTCQMRRSSASIPTNIAEGCGRGTEADFARFLQMAMGSACELEYQLLLSKDLCYISEVTHQQLEVAVVEVKRMLTALIQKLRVVS